MTVPGRRSGGGPVARLPGGGRAPDLGVPDGTVWRPDPAGDHEPVAQQQDEKEREQRDQSREEGIDQRLGRREDDASGAANFALAFFERFDLGGFRAEAGVDAVVDEQIVGDICVGAEAVLGVPEKDSLELFAERAKVKGGPKFLRGSPPATMKAVPDWKKS